MVVGDEMRLRYEGELHKPWNSLGRILKVGQQHLLPTPATNTC